MRTFAVSSVTTLMAATSVTAILDTSLEMESPTYVLVCDSMVEVLLPYYTLKFSFIFSSDIDECALGTAECDPNADCVNTIGSYNCTCRDGYFGNGSLCMGKY